MRINDNCCQKTWGRHTHAAKANFTSRNQSCLWSTRSCLWCCRTSGVAVYFISDDWSFEAATGKTWLKLYRQKPVYLSTSTLVPSYPTLPPAVPIMACGNHMPCMRRARSLTDESSAVGSVLSAANLKLLQEEIRSVSFRAHTLIPIDSLLLDPLYIFSCD